MSKVALSGLTAILLLAPIASFGEEKDDPSGQPTPLELFEQRIMPIFKSPQPASCVQCHLAAVDLKSYILPSHERTFLSLRDQGLIDLSAPEKSKILRLIQMGEKDRDKESRLLHEKVRKAEYEAFAAWITACCQDPKLRELPPLAADCSDDGRDAGESLRIEGVNDGAVLARPPNGVGGVRLSLRALGTASRVQWLLDGRWIGETEGGRSLAHEFAAPGAHELTALADSGAWHSLHFRLLGPASAP